MSRPSAVWARCSAITRMVLCLSRSGTPVLLPHHLLQCVDRLSHVSGAITVDHPFIPDHSHVAYPQRRSPSCRLRSRCAGFNLSHRDLHGLACKSSERVGPGWLAEAALRPCDHRTATQQECVNHQMAIVKQMLSAKTIVCFIIHKLLFLLTSQQKRRGTKAVNSMRVSLRASMPERGNVAKSDTS